MTAASSSGVILLFTSTSIPSLTKTSMPTFCRLSRARTFMAGHSPFEGLLSLLHACELLHEPGERVHPLVGGGVVHGNADSAHGAVPLEPHHAALFGLRDELRLEVLARKPEDHVHHRPALPLHRRPEEPGVRVDDAVEPCRLLPVHFFRLGQAALPFEPGKDVPDHVDAEGGGGVV